MENKDKLKRHYLTLKSIAKDLYEASEMAKVGDVVARGGLLSCQLTEKERFEREIHDNEIINNALRKRLELLEKKASDASKQINSIIGIEINNRKQRPIVFLDSAGNKRNCPEEFLGLAPEELLKKYNEALKEIEELYGKMVTTKK